MLLAIDTSTTRIGLACYDTQGVLGECVWHSGRDHSAQLLPQLTLLLRHLGRTRASIQAVAVALGPGSWSGLRVGMSTAKGLALAQNIPIIGIGSLDALAYQYERPEAATIPLIRLGRERYATGQPSPTTSGHAILVPRNVTLAEVCAETTGRALFCGDIDASVQATLREYLGDRALFPAPPARLPRPGFLAELAWQRLHIGAIDDLTSLEPIYLGEPVKVRAPA